MSFKMLIKPRSSDLHSCLHHVSYCLQSRLTVTLKMHSDVLKMVSHWNEMWPLGTSEGICKEEREA